VCYGTILIDLEQHAVIELLPDRKADPLAQWLQTQPGVEIISRDRAPAYAEAARRGAPQAVQVADRWHLLKNLAEALERRVLRHSKALKVAAGGAESPPGPLPSYADAEQVPWQRRAEAASQQKHAGKVEQHEQIHALAAVGFTKLDIADLVGVSRPTVYRYLELPDPPERRRPRRSRHRVLEPSEPYLQQRWAQGCRNRSRLLREIRAQGYQHGASNVFRFLKRWDRDQPGPVTPPARPRPRVPSARHIACLLIQYKDKLSDKDRDYLTRLCAHEPALATAYELAQEFATIVRDRQSHRFEAWRFRCRELGGQDDCVARCGGAPGDASGRAQIARASCGHAVARRSGRGTASVSVEKPFRRFWTRAWPRVRMFADTCCLKPRIGRSRCLRWPWSRSRPLFRCFDVRCSAAGSSARSAGG
jgi:transposase